MKTYFHIFLFVISILLSETCTAQAQDTITFNRVPLPSSSYSMTVAGVQDPQGYLWLANYGLHRYDGYNYTSYFNDPLDPRSLAGDRVEPICAARNGIIWVGTSSGLDRLDPVTGIFTHFRHNSKNAASLSSDTVSVILEDRAGNIWVGTHRGLNQLDLKTGKFIRYGFNPTDSTSLSHDQVRAIYEDRQGIIWVGTGSAFEGNLTKGGGLNRLNRNTGTFIRYLHDAKNPQSLIDNRVRAIYEDSRGTFWVGTAGDGLHTMDRVKGCFERHRYDHARPEGLSRPPQKKNQPWADDHITFITEDATGAIWIGTFGNGINRYNPKTKKISHFPPFKDKMSGAQQTNAWWASTSRDGVLWIGYWQGLFRIDPLRKNIPYFTVGRPVRALYEDNNGMLWYGSELGLVRKDRINGTRQQFVHDPRNSRSISNNKVISIYEDRQGVLWIGTDSGLNRFDHKMTAFTHYVSNLKDNNSLTSVIITCIYEDRKGAFWVGTDKGLNLMNRQAGTFSHYLHNKKDSNSLSNSDIKCIYQDRLGDMWIGTFQGGLNRLTTQTGRIERFLYGADINSLLEDSEGIFWVGTSKGLYRSNHTKTSFSRFSDTGNEIANDIVIMGILEDNQKQLWINTSIGIFKINHQRNELVSYGENYGLNSQSLNIGFESSGYHKGKSGEFFFGSGSGYYSFFPEQLTDNAKPPQIVITGFRLADEPLLPDKSRPLSVPLAETKEIQLNHNQNAFSFDFVGIHYSSPEQNRHLFMLENLDNTWRKAGQEKTAYYYNVPPGRYIFRVKSANSSGVWAEKSIAVIITPPWWNNWWAYLIYVSVFVVIMWLFVRYRSRRLKTENILLEEKVIRRTNELEQSLEERYKLNKKIEGQQALLNERLRISRELHDDIGSTLGSISIYSEVAKKRSEKNKNTNEVLSKIGMASRELIDKMSDIVWSLNPNNESFEQLQNRMMGFAAIMLTPINIQYDLIADEGLKKLQFQDQQRKNIFLIFKEALHNIVKYADCKTVRIRMFLENDYLVMIIKDNGKGFNVYQTTANEIFTAGEYLGGNGIKNMKARADDMNAKFCISSKINEGTTVQLTLPI